MPTTDFIKSFRREWRDQCGKEWTLVCLAFLALPMIICVIKRPSFTGCFICCFLAGLPFLLISSATVAKSGLFLPILVSMRKILAAIPKPLKILLALVVLYFTWPLLIRLFCLAVALLQLLFTVSGVD